ncbi:polyprenyl synthetase family protein [Ruminococcus sp.]|uniref:polyprenyl synthetase family protein n=1 Tax=Ruminococcus sp. TaxID=41978 RepID=UPI001B4A7AF7|nr:farnesyl diphosphate synthase [Ruminococcus sp.]MBP5430938.1 polyprenyl synthetase family protein [Ruminococcus sp.]
MNSFKERLSEYISFTEDNLKAYNSHSLEMAAQKNLIDAMNYSLEAGGKRIRPVLVYAFCNALGGDYKNTAAPAAAIEMIHTFSLIHDDLPAMDNDDYRRGKLSCHKAFGEAMAILAGDALSVLPFEIIADDDRLDAEKKIKIISCLAKAVGREGMIGGQVIDMENETRTDVDESNLRNMYHHKTGQLIAVSCMMGCICAGADDEKIKAAADYGFRLGLAFQIIDDILDVTSTTEELGKPVGSDEEENKTTFVTLYGVERAQEIANAVTDEALAYLDKFGNDDFLMELTEMLLKRKN